DEGGLMPLHQVLVYPVTTFAPEGESLESIQEYANAIPLSAAALEWFGMHYLADPADATNPYASPLEAADLSGLPPVTMIQAEIDPLQSQGTVYADALEAAGVTVSRTLYEGVTHEFFGMTKVVDKAADAVDQVATEVNAALGG
ncbi:MAG: alpha/beta hydrolase, partial [Chloroflexota bacterium]|nr:alpha/beta hydrolase [Chloroflexota bacterium]